MEEVLAVLVKGVAQCVVLVVLDVLVVVLSVTIDF